MHWITFILGVIAGAVMLRLGFALLAWRKVRESGRERGYLENIEKHYVAPPGVNVFLNASEGAQLFERAAQRYLSISGEEFLRRWDSGSYTDESVCAMRVALLIPFVRPFSRLDDEQNMYEVNMFCRNCGHFDTAKCVKGVLASNLPGKCPKCDCLTMYHSNVSYSKTVLEK